MNLFSRNKRIAIGLVMVLLFTIMPVNYDIAGEGTAITDNLTEYVAGEQNEPGGTAEVSTETAARESIVPERENTETTEAETKDIPPALREVLEKLKTGKNNISGEEGSTESGKTKKDDLLEETLDSRLADGAADLFDNTTIRLDSLTLEAAYKDENGKKQVVNLSTTETITLPNDADISMDFRFVMGNGNAVDCSKQYVYQIPDGVRVDVNATHELMDAEGKSIGRVVISQDGTMTFTFYESAIKDQPNVPFYVRFEGGFSSDLQQDMGKHDLSFPTASGQFTYSVDITGSNNENEDKEPGELKTYKSGSKVTRDGKPYIEWTVEVDLNGREYLTADVVDALPAGLTYVPGSAALADERYGSTGSVTASEQNGRVVFHVQDSRPNWRTRLTFLTSYDTDIFPDKITNNSGAMVNNTVAVNPENESQSSVTGSGSVYIVPSVLEKGGRLDITRKTIVWTVTLNKDKMDIGGTTYTDTFGNGVALADGDTPRITSGGGTITRTDEGFTWQAPASPYNEQVVITYETPVENISQPNFKNTGKLTGDKYDVSTEANVRGMDLIQKAATAYNEITRQFTWTITVNDAGAELENAKVEDMFSSEDMTLVDIQVANANGSAYTGGTVNGNTITLGTITDKKIITVVTKLKEPSSKWQQDGWYSVNNRATLTWGDGNTATAEASRNFQYKEPDLFSKNGEVTKNGTVLWTLEIKEPQLKQEGIKLSDKLPAGMEYVEGSFQLKYFSWAWDSSQMMKVNPTYDKTSNTLSYELKRGALSDSYYIDHSFIIQYETRLTSIANADKQGKYTNNATIEVDYEGDVKVTDTATKTVEGTVGGTVGKEFAYTGGNDYVDWTVKINEAGYDMSAIKNPIIKDRLESYFDYVSGKLYKIVGGQRQEVPASEYTVVAVNRNITVKLPNIGKDTYEFEFRTKFNISDNRLESMTIKNTVDFTGDGYQESVTSDEVKNVSFSSSSAGSVLEKELRIRKVDAAKGTALAGAKFELFYDGVSVGTAVSGADGYAVFSGINSATTGITYSLVETEAPDGYVKNEGEEEVTVFDGQLKTDTSGVRYIEHVVNNQPIKKQTQLNIYKTDTENKILAEAEFGLYRDAACKDLMASRISGTDGMVTFSVEYSDAEAVTYYLKELNPPAGYLKEDVPTVYSATVGTDGTVTYSANAETVNGLTVLHVKNVKGEAKLKLRKVKKGDESVRVAGATFTIYRDSACTDVVDRETTDADGMLTFANMELGRTYYYRETAAPEGYEIDSTIHSITVGDGTENVNVEREITVENEVSLGYIEITKTDDAVPANPLSGITFALYEADGTTAYMRNGVQYTAATDSAGKAVFTDLEYGTYIVKETGTKAGYVANTEDIRAVVDSTRGVKMSVINTRMKFNIKVRKTDDSSPAKPLEGVTFVLYTKEGKIVKNGKTDANGELTFSDIAYGNYYVKETAGVKGYIVSDEEWQIKEENILADDQTLTKTYVNKKENASIRFTKKDGANAGNILAGAEFTIYDSNGLVVDSASSDENGVVLFSHLIYDTYTIRETTAPEDYKLDNTVWVVKVDANNVYQEMYTGSLTGTRVSEVVNERLELGDRYLSFHVLKMDENNMPLQGARFSLSKQEKGSKDWEVLANAVSDKNGIVQFHNIAIDKDDSGTKYKLEEVAAPPGYRLDSKNSSKIYSYSDITQMQIPDHDRVGHFDWKTDFTLVPIINTYKNQQIFGKIRIVKTGLTTLTKLQGAEFTLYEEDGTTAYRKEDGTVYKAVTDANGIAVFEHLPLGYYVVKETDEPDGYLLNSLYMPSVDMVVKDTDGDVQEIVREINFRDTPISVSVSKMAVGGSVGLEGAKLAVYDSADNLIDSWETTDESHRLPATKLKTGEIYTLKEIKAPDGYRFANPVKFIIRDDGSVEYKEGDGSVSENHVIMRDSELSLRIRKLDEKGQDLVGALLELVEDATGEVVYSFTSDGRTRSIPSNVLKVPEEGTEYTYYTIREKSAPMEYELAEDIKLAIDRNGKIYLVNGTSLSAAPNPIVMTDNLKTDFYFSKADIADDSRLPGAKLEIVELPSGEQKYEWVSGSAPKKFTLEDGTYALREKAAPDGYTVAKDEVKFTVETVDNKQVITSMSGDAGSLSYDKMTLAIRDAAISVRVRKLTENTVILPGASFELYQSDENGTQGEKLESFVTTEESTDLDYRNLKLETYYLLVETEAPKGYELVAPILFYIDKDGVVRDQSGEVFENNLIEVVDGEKRLSVQKTDASTGNPLSGVRLMISSQDDEDFQAVDWLTDGKAKEFEYSLFKRNVTYTLSEVSTVNGYTYADAVDFMITDEDKCVYANGTPIAGDRIVMKNSGFEIAVRKMSLKTKRDLAGAKLAVRDAAGNLVEQWVSDGSSHKLDAAKFHVSKGGDEYVYTLSEVEAPELYGLAQPIAFVIDEKGKVKRLDNESAANNTIIMNDEYRGLSFSKKDTGGKEVPGAILTITSAEDTDFKTLTWESTDTPKDWSLDLFKRNTDYTLTEEAAPNGYAYAESITFRIDDNGIIYVNGTAVDNQTVTMVDEVLSVTVEKKVKGTKKFLSGASLSVVEEKTGTVIHTWKTKEKAVKIPAKRLTASKGDNKVIYILRENKAPEGYNLAKDIRFYLDEQGIVYTIDEDGNEKKLNGNAVIMYDAKKKRQVTTTEATTAKTTEATTAASTEAPKTSESVKTDKGAKTGDASPIDWVMRMLFLSASAGCGLLYYRKKRH
ncbi:MAG: SpaA isopeptide-forming pilin-related protein [Bacteroidales bacterium]|nr:SpaA isopeptide-forming pilin-related protein [Clostridium sp.]MCM1204126.1 SpaA isopeptide-forming pilin-related protein [Bacteroidales bacterium]